MTNTSNITGDRLRSIIEKIEELENEKKDLQSEIKDIEGVIELYKWTIGIK